MEDKSGASIYEEPTSLHPRSYSILRDMYILVDFMWEKSIFRS